jgi:hypothetical protein
MQPRAFDLKVTMKPRRPADEAPSHDVGTLWLMKRGDHTARCALLESLGDWHVRVVVDGRVILADRCRRGPQAFEVADLWKTRMSEDGWHQVLPQRLVPGITSRDLNSFHD